MLNFRGRPIVVIGCAVLSLLGFGVHAQNAPVSAENSFLANRGKPDVVGGYDSSQMIVQLKTALPAGTPTNKLGHPGLDAVLATKSTSYTIRPAYPLPFKYPEVANEVGLDRFYLIRFPNKRMVDANLTQALKAVPRTSLESAELISIGSPGLIPNDEFFPIQFSLQNRGDHFVYDGKMGGDIRATEAWDTINSSDNIVAVIDSGVAPHPEFYSTNGDRRLLPGMNMATLSPLGTTDEGCAHGTSVAGIVAANGNNGKGTAGIDWGAKILPVKVLGAGCAGPDSLTADGIIWATDQGAKVLTMSLQFSEGSSYLRTATEYANRLRRAMMACTGNWGQAFVAFPARFPNVIAVGAVDNRDLKANFSNFGVDIDIVAPGVYLYTTAGSNDYTLFSGTSAATPVVAGVVSLMRGRRPELSPEDIEFILKKSADPLGDPFSFGSGRVNLAAAIRGVDNFCRADFNFDGVTDMTDLTGPTGFKLAFDRRLPRTDFNQDYVIDYNDFLEFIAAYHRGCN